MTAWAYNFEGMLPGEREEVLLACYRGEDGCVVMAWMDWVPDPEEPATRVLKWCSTFDGRPILPPLLPYGWAHYEKPLEPTEALAAEEDEGDF